MKAHCAHGERHNPTSNWDRRDCIWLPETSAEWTTVIASLVLLIYIIREYVIPVLKGYARRRCMVLEVVDAAVLALASAVLRTIMP